MKLHCSHITILGVTLLTLAIDQLSKWYLLFVVSMPTRPPIVVTEFFSLVMVWNRGVSFGMFSDPHRTPYVLAALAVVICAVLLRLALKTPHHWERVGYAMVIGGALGNVVDRLRFGAVADFFYAHIGDLGWPAFNVADMAIFFGVAILLIMLWRTSSRP